MKHSTLTVALLLPVALAAGCTTTGTGFGSAPSGGSDVSFSWKSSDSVSGSIDATVSGGATFTGKYIQITSNTTVDTLGPMWVGWGPGWGYGYGGEWALWDSGPSFATHYSGKVVANLASADAKHMRCVFRLVHPSDGMAGGGQGRCQLPDGKTIDATFPAAGETAGTHTAGRGGR